MSNNIRVGVIGVGYMGWNHAKLYKQLRGVDLVGVSDRDQRRAVETASEFDTESMPTAELLSEVDAVSIAVPTEYHGDIIEDSLNAGVHVLVEKPFVSNTARGRALIERSEEEGLVLQVGHVERFNAAVQTLVDIVSHLDIVALSTRRVGPAVDRELSDSVALDLMIHDIDIVLSILDEPLEELTSVSSIGGEHATAAMRFGDGVVVDMTASRITQREVRKIEVVTKSGCVIADCLNQTVEFHKAAPSLATSLNGHQLYECDGVIEHPRVTQTNPLLEELNSFVGSITDGTPPVVSGRDGLRAVEIAQHIESAAHSNEQYKPLLQ